jgi:hypothetical protein
VFSRRRVSSVYGILSSSSSATSSSSTFKNSGKKDQYIRQKNYKSSNNLANHSKSLYIKTAMKCALSM